MRSIGYHTSISKGWTRAMEEVQKFGASTFQFFTRNPRGAKAREVDGENVTSFEARRGDFGPLFAHAAYTMNLASSKEAVCLRSRRLLEDDLRRLALYPKDTIYLFHPGAHTGDGIHVGMERIVRAVASLKAQFPDAPMALETMSGKGTEIGSCFEEIATMLEGIGDERFGVILDTCHLHSAGYDLTRPEAVAEAMDHTFGLNRVFGIHVNDSKTDFGAKKDRHALLGAGDIGLEILADFLAYEAFRDLPLILETPGEGEDHAEEIRLLKEALSQRGGL